MEQLHYPKVLLKESIFDEQGFQTFIKGEEVEVVEQVFCIIVPHQHKRANRLSFVNWMGERFKKYPQTCLTGMIRLVNKTL
jgi:hypothetical protein